MNGPWVEPVIAGVGRLVEEVARIGGMAVKDGVLEARGILNRPQLRLAVVGRVKAGKSTLVNALLGRRVAATDEAECTKVVTHYVWGAPERGEVHLLDGRVVPIPLVDRRLPDVLGGPIEEVSHVVVYLQEAALRDFTLVDTPGLSTTTTALDQATRRAVLEARHADALVYVFRDVQRRDDVEILKDFAQVSGSVAGRSPGPAAAIGVLSHADTFGSGPWGDEDAIAAATNFAADIAVHRAGELAAVIPISGLMAESATTGRVTEEVTRELAKLADRDPIELRWPDEDLSARTAALAGVVGDYGLRNARDVAGGGSGALVSWLLERSNHRGLVRALRDRYVGRHPALRARAAVEALQAAGNAAGPGLAWSISRIIAEALLDPQLHPLAELRAWEELRSSFPEHWVTEKLDQMVTGSDDARRVGLDPGSDRAMVRAAALQLATQARGAAAVAVAPGLVYGLTTLERSATLVARRHPI